MEIRPARGGDIPAAAALEAETFPDGASAAYLESLRAGGGADEGYVGNVAVAEPFRRRGVGEALVRAMLADAKGRGAAFLTLEVRESNRPARRLYERCGFRTVAVRKDYYERPREDAVLMTAFFGEEE